ncbi:MAG: beta-ketoacyl synthase N-terminal-like domain-containing protein [Pseudonocardiaceae bacterium]
MAGVTATQPPVAIVGMSVLLPGAADLDAYWRNLVDGVDSITEVPEHRWEASFYDPAAASGPARADRVYCRRGGFVDDLAEIDPVEFGIMPNSVASTEPDQLIALKVAAAAVADAGGRERLPERDRIGVILGRSGHLTPGLVRLEQRVRTSHQLIRTLSELAPGLLPEQLNQIKDMFTERLGNYGPDVAIGLVPALAASRIAARLDFRGPAYTLDAACASALFAVDQAVGELARGRCDLVLAGGVHHCHDILLWSVLTQFGVLSPSQRMRPFDRAADGLLIGEGTGVVALKRLADAERDGDRVYAVIRGTGVASDGKGASLFSPEPEGQALAIRRAWRAAGLDPAEPGSIGLLEASGTATPAGDQAELTALTRVFGPTTGERAVIGSVKSMIGHTMSTGGIAGLIKAALAVQRGVLLPTLGCDDPHPALARTRFRVIDSAEPWEPGDGKPVRRAAVNSFGFGGINAHAVVEQPAAVHVPPQRQRVSVSEPERVLRVAAATPSGLAELLNRDDTVVLRALSGAESSVGPSAERCRLGVVNPTPKRLAAARRVVAQGASWRGHSDIWFSPQPLLHTPASGRIGFIFPGLEAEFAPRVDDVADHFGLPRPDISLSNAGRHGMAVVAVSRLLDRALRRLGVRPDVVAGHSGGEFTAMISAGMFSDAEADQFVESLDPDALRFPDVVFAVLGCGADRLVDALADHQDIVLSHDNSPHQAIVCGPAAAVDELVRAWRARGVLGRVLPLRSGLHTSMMEPYLNPAREVVSRLRLHPPTVPIWSSTLVAPYPADEAEVKALMVRHLLEPVRFRPLIEAMYAAGVTVFVQVGTGQLGSLIDDTLRGREHLTVVANSPHRGGLDQLRRVVTALWVEGGSPDWPTTVGRSRRGQPVKLDLSTGLVSLGGAAPSALPGLAASLSQSLSGSPLSGSLARLDQLAASFPLAAELTGLLRETADAAAAVIGAHDSRPASTAVAPREVATVLRVSTETMPYLRDHCFVRQRADWPAEADRWPIVPGATLVQHMIDAAERAVPGRFAVAAHDLRLNRWLVAAPAVDVPVTAVVKGSVSVEVSVGQYAHATIELGERYPDPPVPWPVDTTAERAPDVTAQEFYAQRWAFQGPRFRGITDLIAQSERHVRGVITTPAAPGGLLDNLAQLVWYWTMSTQTTKRAALPVRVEHIRLFGPHPGAGTVVDATVRFRSVTDAAVRTDMQVVHRGRVWAHIEGWHSRRFDSDLETEAAERFPEEHTLSRISPRGWAVLFDRWPDLASRDLIMRGYLSAGERTDYDRCSPRARRPWLLGRIAVKDAVRRWLWDQGYGPVFPAEVQVSNDERGRPRVAGWPGRALPPLEVSLAHCQRVGVAIAQPRSGPGGPGVDGSGVGIDVEEITERDDRTHDVALSPRERALLAACRAETGESAAVWFTRFWTAKEAVSKAEGTGLGGRPRRFAVIEASRTELSVQVRPEESPEENTAGCSGTYRVRCERLSNCEDQRERHYVVAWTTGPAARAGGTQ